MKSLFLTAALSSAALAIAGCTTAPDPGDGPAETAEAAEIDPRRGEQVDRICFASQIDNFTETTRRTVVVEARLNEFYQIETASTCLRLDGALSLGFDTFGGSNCLSRGDSIIASDSAFGLRSATGIGPQRCLISRIYRWDPEALDQGDTTENDASEPSPDEDNPET